MEGRLQEGKELLRALLEDRFGPLPQEVAQQIESCSDPAFLRTAIRQAWRVQALSEFRLAGPVSP